MTKLKLINKMILCWIMVCILNILGFASFGYKDRYKIAEKQNTSTAKINFSNKKVISEYQKVLSQNHIWFTSQNNSWTAGAINALYKISADSVSIGNHYYYQVLSSADRGGNLWTETAKYVRETAGQLWVLDSLNADAGEILIMDMNLITNDIFEYSDVFGQFNRFFVSNTDTIVDLSGKSRKVVYLSCEGSISFVFRWIEGIGPDAGVFQSWLEQCTIDGNPNMLTCFYSDNVQQWQNPDFSKCWTNPLVADTTDMDYTTIWYSSSYTGNIVDRDCELKIDITKVVRDSTIDDRVCRIIGVFSAGKYLSESEIITFQKADKLYFFEDNTWKLLYDFSAQVGDTVTYYVSKKYPYYFKYAVPGYFDQEIMDRNPYQLLVEKLDTVYTVEGKPLKRFYTKSLDAQQDNIMDIIIENVGSNFKLFGNSTIITPPECFKNFPSLRCYSDDDASIKFTEGECEKLNSTKDVLDININVYPNPGQDKMTITLGSEAEMPITYKVAEISGRILSREVTHLSSFELNSNQLRSGLYIITVSDKSGKIWQGKLVKQ